MAFLEETTSIYVCSVDYLIFLHQIGQRLFLALVGCYCYFVCPEIVLALLDVLVQINLAKRDQEVVYLALWTL